MASNNVYYQRDATFIIQPRMRDIDVKRLLQHIVQLKKMYTADSSHTFFWKFDVKNNSIVIDESSISISFDIQEQLSMIAVWIFEHGYLMKGQFTLKVNKLIRHFAMDGVRKSISTLELFDDADVKYTDCENIIMYDAKTKIDAYLGNETLHKINQVDTILNKATVCQIDISWTEDTKEYRSSFSKKEICPSKQTLLRPFKYLVRNVSAFVTMIAVSCLVRAYISNEYVKV